MLHPSDCNFMICLPLTEEQFLLDGENVSKHFVREHLRNSKLTESKQQSLWTTYAKEVVYPYQKLKEQFSRYGFSFTESVAFDDFTKMLERYQVNILFSHCKTGDEEAIEFYDRLVYTNEFINSIPLNFNKVIDLSVCNPNHTASELKNRRRMAIVKSTSKSISFIYWLYFYGLIFESIYEQKIMHYTNAIEFALSKLYSNEA